MMKTRGGYARQQRKGWGSNRPGPWISSSPGALNCICSLPRLTEGTSPEKRYQRPSNSSHVRLVQGRHRHDVRLQMLRPGAPDDPFGGEQHDRRYAQRCGKVTDSRVVAEIRDRPAQRTREDWELRVCEQHHPTDQLRGQRRNRLGIGRAPMNHDGETRQRRRESLENGGESRRRPALPTPTGTGMDEEESRLVVPASSSKCEARFVDDARRDNDRPA